MSVKLKVNDQWLDADEALALQREAGRIPPPEPPPVDVATLPEPGQIDPDVPFAQLCFERPEVLAYITKKGEMRSGLTASQRETAKAILQRYARSL